MTGFSNDDKYLSKQVRTVSRPSRKKLGEILVENGILTAFTVERILTLSVRAGKRFGTVLEEIGLVTGEELARALAMQYGYKTVTGFAAHQFPQSILKLVPVETAVEHTVFPLKLQNHALAIAMIDPTNERLIDNIKQNSQMQVYPFIATRKDINDAIAKHYLKRTIVAPDSNTILLVEDDKIVLTTIKNILQNEGYKVVTATNGMEAFKEIIANKPRLILTDKEMPKFDGYALLESLRHIPETKLIPVILISETSNPDEEAIAYEKGFFDFIPKPVKEITLKAKVKRALKSHSQLLPGY